MTSTHSDSAPRQPPQFPSRDQLPAGVEIPRVPILGTTWYERGASYWARRAGMTLLFLVFLAAWTAMIGAFVRASGPEGSPAFIGVLAAEIVFSLVSGAWMLNCLWKHTGARATPSVRTVGIVSRATSVLVIAFFGIAVLLTYGLVLAGFITALAPVLPPERDARLLLAERLQKGPRRVPLTARSGGHPGSKRQTRGGRR